MTDNEPHLLWRDVPELARQARFRPHGHYGGQPGADEAALAWKALALLNQPVNKPEAILLTRDDDGGARVARGGGVRARLPGHDAVRGVAVTLLAPRERVG